MKVTRINNTADHTSQVQTPPQVTANPPPQMTVRRIVHEQEIRKRNVAAYARVSTLTEEQDESFETQVSYYTNLIKNTEQWNFAGIYADHGKSGLSAAKRPEFQRMIQDAMDGKIDIILVKSISRFGRNSLEAQTYVHKLKEIGVEVRFEREQISSFDPQADMVFNFLVAVAQAESNSISQNIRWSYEKLAEQGIRHLGNNRVLGYDEVDGVLTPNEDAWVVRFIFEEYANGKSMRKIADELEKMGFETMRGCKKLSVATIEGILRNEIYKGDRRLQKTSHVNLLTHRPEKGTEYKTYYLEADHEGIVSKELWEKVQEVLATPKKELSNKNSHFLRGKIICEDCGETFVRISRRNAGGKYKCWVCKGRRERSGCKNIILREDYLLSLIAEMIGASDEKTCVGIEQIFVFSNGRLEVEMMEE